jgi:hypothetical protein
MKGIGTVLAYIKRGREAIKLFAFYHQFPIGDNVGIQTGSLIEDSLDLVTIAFNSPDMIQHQYRLLRKFITDSYRYTVADNSTDEVARAEIRAFCVEQGIPYMALPPSPYVSSLNSKSHGAALNYVYRNYIKPRSARFFGFLDHDIFPVAPVAPKDYLKKQPFYGMLQECNIPHIRGGRLLYLWPGLAFFDSTYTQGMRLNFLPDYGGDTGSGCFYSLYKPLLMDQGKEEVFRFAEERRISLWEGNDFQNDMYAYFDNEWLHMANASNWRNAVDFKKKKKRMEELLESL